MLTPGDQQAQVAVPPALAGDPPPLKKVTSQLASAQETFGVEFQEVQENGVRGLFLKGARAGSAMSRVGLMPGLLVSLNGQRVSGAADVARIKKESTDRGVLTFDWEIDPRFRPSYTGKTFTPVEPNPRLGIRRDKMVSGDNIYMCCEVRKISSKEKVIAQRRLLVLTDRVMFTTDLSSGDKKVLDVKPIECVALILLQRGCTPDNQILIQMARQQSEYADMHFHFVGSADNSPPNVTVQELCQCIKYLTYRQTGRVVDIRAYNQASGPISANSRKGKLSTKNPDDRLKQWKSDPKAPLSPLRKVMPARERSLSPLLEHHARDSMKAAASEAQQQQQEQQQLPPSFEQQPKEASPSPPPQAQQPSPSEEAARPSAFPPVQAELPRTPLRKVVLVEREVHTSRSASPRRSSEAAPPLPQQQQEGVPPGSDFGYASPVNPLGPGVVPASTVSPHYPMPPPTLLPPAAQGSPFVEQHPQHASYGQQPYYAHAHPQPLQQASMHDPIYGMGHSPAYSHGAMQQQMPMVPYSPVPVVPGLSDSDSDSDDLQPLVPYRTPSRSQQAYAQIQASPNVLVNVHLNFVNIHDRA